MTVLLTAHGSRGDVYPMIALGAQFVAEGYETLMLTQVQYRDELEANGIRGIFMSEDMHEVMSSLGSDWKSVRRMLKWSQASLKEEFELLEAPISEAELVVSTNQEFSVASLAEWKNVPAYRLSYIPAIPGDHTPPLIPWPRLPVMVNRLLWKSIGSGLNLMARGLVNDWRADKGLPKVPNLTPHMTSVFHTLYAFSETLAPPHPSWDDSTYSYSGYCFEKDEKDLPQDIEDFLSAGPKPIYLGFGSVSVPDPDKLTEIAVEAALQTGCRLIISKGWTGLGSEKILAKWNSDELENKVLVIGEVSHTSLFPRLAAVCHHGGAGTVHRAARAGVPQLVMPLIVDQFFWGYQIHQSGAGPKPIKPKHVTLKKLSSAFENLLNQDSYNLGCARLSGSIEETDGARKAFETIVNHMKSRAA